MACNHDGNPGFASRRTFLSDVGMGFTGLVLGSMFSKEGLRNSALAAESSHVASEHLPGQPHFPPKAKSVIWIFLTGGLSHLESFDHKPEITKYAGLDISQTPHRDVLNASFNGNVRIVVPNDANGRMRNTLYPTQVGFKKYGQSGLEISDWFSHIGQCADDLAIVRSVWTTDNNHGAQLQFHTGRHILDGQFPTIGSWINYGLATENESLPSFVVLGQPIADCCGGIGAHGANYLGPEHSGVQLGVDPKNPLPFSFPQGGIYREEQRKEFELLSKLHDISAVEYPEDATLSARIRSYELAFRMQSALPSVMNSDQETKETRQLYGFDRKETRVFARQCLAARRLVEKGVRFVQLFHGSNGGAGGWDAHRKLNARHSTLSNQIDQPIAALIKDLKRTGLLDETLVVIGTEFGRTPGTQGVDGRDHHPFAFSVVMAGGGLKGGLTHGRTDALGFHAIEDRHFVTDIHATILHQLGLDSRKLEIPGRKRLDIDHGSPIKSIIA
ncbi:MAG: DUF1501 domain-containing protein [Planctomycetota bacterium]|nr:DUF1501 domain-containing protein [Planctomycetota bacterium]